MKKFILNSGFAIGWTDIKLTGIFAIMFNISLFISFISVIFDVIIFILKLFV
jgi:hypothetical protein